MSCENKLVAPSPPEDSVDLLIPSSLFAITCVPLSCSPLTTTSVIPLKVKL